MTYSLGRNDIHFNYTMSNALLNKCIQYKDWGVLFDVEVSFDNHINSILIPPTNYLAFHVHVVHTTYF